MSKTREETEKIIASRNQMVVQSNDFIRHSRNQMTPQEMNIIYFLISKVKPTEKDFTTVTLNVEEFCEICGINESGKNYTDIKKTLKSIADKSAWVEKSQDIEKLVRWVDTYEIRRSSGTITAVLSQSIKPFLLGLINKGFYTQAELVTFLALKSRYSKRMYEILKSYLDTSEEKRYRLVIQKFEIMELKRMVAAEKYARFADFRVRVLDIAMREINEVTDISVTYTPKKKGRITTQISFSIQLKNAVKRLDARSSAKNVLDGK
jgi:plasmid replication initiation protein